MKKLIYIIIFCLPILVVGQNEMQAESNFNGRHCRGTVGLCNIGSSIEGKSISNSKVMYDTNQGIVLTIEAGKLTNEEVLKVFGEPINETYNYKNLEMKVEADFEIEVELLKALKVPQNRVVIKAGTYPTTFKDNSLQIIFEVD
jgi:hypothetical protein